MCAQPQGNILHVPHSAIWCAPKGGGDSGSHPSGALWSASDKSSLAGVCSQHPGRGDLRRSTGIIPARLWYDSSKPGKPAQALLPSLLGSILNVSWARHPADAPLCRCSVTRACFHRVVQFLQCLAAKGCLGYSEDPPRPVSEAGPRYPLAAELQAATHRMFLTPAAALSEWQWGFDFLSAIFSAY